MKITVTKDSDGSSLNSSTLMRGDTEIIRVRLLNQNVNEANYQFRFTVKLNESDPDINAIITKSTGGAGITKNLVSPTVLEALIPISGADTELLLGNETLFYDIQMYMINPQSVRTLQKGKFRLEADITQTNSP